MAATFVSQRPGQLEDAITLVEASIADARAEFERGELNEEQWKKITARDEARLHQLRSRIPDATEEAPRRRWASRRKYLVIALCSFSVALGLVLWSSLVSRQPGQSATGGVTAERQITINTELAQAEGDVAAGNLTSALAAYNQVLRIDARNITALTQTGWLYCSAGASQQNPTLVKLGISRLTTAINSAPRNPAPRLYYAITLASTANQHAAAIVQFKIFKSLSPNPTLAALAQPWELQLGI